MARYARVAFFKNRAFLEAIEHAKKHDSALHLMGCTSLGGIHSHLDHLIALLELAHKNGLKKIFIHFIADGQDMPPQNALNVLDTLKPFLKKFGGRIASMQGRSFAMDRVLNWKVTKQVWDAVVLGSATAIDDPATYLKEAYKKGMTDYSLEPVTVVDEGKPIGLVQDNDAFIFFDFRNDRVKQLASPFILGRKFESFDRTRSPKNVIVVTMTKYAEEFDVPVAYPASDLEHTLGQVVSHKKWRQWRIAEKEKEAHVTNFFNGGRIKAFEGEQREIVSSRMMRGEEYIEHPEMSAEKIVHAVLEKMDDSAHLYVINFANPDMIGHTGNLVATKKSIKITDDCLKQLVGKLSRQRDWAIIITADHGNAEELLDPLTKGEDTQHSTRSVPVIFIAKELAEKGDKAKSLESLAQEAPLGSLVDIAPSILYLLGVEKPEEMTGSHLVSL